jgi:hypothetical protein
MAHGDYMKIKNINQATENMNRQFYLAKQIKAELRLFKDLTTWEHHATELCNLVLQLNEFTSEIGFTPGKSQKCLPDVDT